MEKGEPRKIDKSKWGEGPWQSEPDRMEWEYKGLPCLMQRNMDVTGSWCGYAAVPEGHPFYGVWYGGCFKGCRKAPKRKSGLFTDSKLWQEMQKKHPDYVCDYDAGHRPQNHVDVHGGLTYSDHCNGHICHKSKPGEPDNVWWFGFDCAHVFDLSPVLRAILRQVLGRESFRDSDEHYWTAQEVKEEVQRLADQLAVVK